MLEVEGLHAGYRDLPVVRGATLSVRDGEIVALVGRNGAGKTTLARALVGLLRASSGEIRFGGRAVTGLPAEARARLGMAYVPQGREVFGRLTVGENLSLGAMAARERPGSAEDVSGWFPVLRERLAQKAATLSGGEQQMLALGRALMARPSLIVLDEPSDGVQPSIVDRVADVLREVGRRRGCAILLVEQNIDLVLAVAERCLAMDKGTIAAEVLPEGVRDPAFVRRFLAI